MASVLVVHGSQDTVVPLADSEELVNSAPKGMFCRLDVVDDIHPLHNVGTAQAMKGWIDEVVAMSQDADDEAEAEEEIKKEAERESSSEEGGKGGYGAMEKKKLDQSFSALMAGLKDA
jgi:hypothetical protein